MAEGKRWPFPSCKSPGFLGIVTLFTGPGQIIVFG